MKSQEYFAQVRRERFEDQVAVPHQITIADAKLIEKENVVSGKEIVERMNLQRFDISSFGNLLNHLDFWKSLSHELMARFPELQDIDWNRFTVDVEDENFWIFFNVLNGGLKLDFEKIFDGVIGEELKILRNHKFYRHGEKKLAYSISDVIGLLLIKKLNSELSEEENRHIAELNGKILDDRVNNAERVKIRQEIRDFYRGREFSDEAENLRMCFAEMEQRLILKPDIEFGFSEQDLVDLIICIYSFDLEASCYETMKLAHKYPNAKLILSGSRSPHQTLESGKHIRHTESEEMEAVLLSQGFRSLYAGMPDRNYLDVFPNPNIDVDRIYAIEGRSLSTAGNALNTTELVSKFADEIGRRVNLAIVTSNMHTGRASWEFASRLSLESVDQLRLVSAPDALFDNGFEYPKITEVLAIIAEYIKRLYEIQLSGVESEKKWKNYEKMLRQQNKLS